MNGGKIEEVDEEESQKSPLKSKNTVFWIKTIKGMKSFSGFNSLPPYFDQEKDLVNNSNIDHSSFSNQSMSEGTNENGIKVDKSIMRNFNTIFSEKLNIETGEKVKIKIKEEENEDSSVEKKSLMEFNINDSNSEEDQFKVYKYH